MVLTAPNAHNYTATAITVHQDAKLQQEVDLTERRIRNTANRDLYEMVYDARIVGNPLGDPQDDNNLTALQIDYRDAFVDVGYSVTRDGDSGLWRLSWATQGVENRVSVYMVRTTVTPGAISQLTVDAIDAFFAAQIPTVRPNTTFVNLGNGGDIQESDFGGTDSVFYEYSIVTEQQISSTDLSGGLRAHLTTSGLGYIDAPSNLAVYKLV